MGQQAYPSPTRSLSVHCSVFAARRGGRPAACRPARAPRPPANAMLPACIKLCGRCLLQYLVALYMHKGLPSSCIRDCEHIHCAALDKHGRRCLTCVLGPRSLGQTHACTCAQCTPSWTEGGPVLISTRHPVFPCNTATFEYSVSPPRL